MRPRIDTVGDDALEDYGVLKYTDETLKSTFLTSFNTMRKHRLFCDVILNVESTDFHVHRNVMASVSPHLMELFSAEQQTQKVVTGEGVPPSYILNSGMTKVAMQILIDYSYTANLEVPDALVKDVYLAAWKLRMEAVINECARHLIQELTPDSCIEIRSLPGISGNKTLIAALDTFINSNFAEVGQSAGFLQMPCIQIEVLYTTKQEMSIVSHNSIARLVLDWMKRQLNTEELTMDNLMERSHLLYLAMDNSLQDCCDLPVGHESETELVQDYKRLVLKCPNNKARRKCLAQTTRPRVLIYSRDISEREEKQPMEPDWNLIGSTKMGENSFVSVVTLNGLLSRISMQLRLNTPAPAPSPNGIVPESPLPFKTADSLDSCGTSSNASDDPQTAELFCEMAVMAGSKCSLGVAELDGKMLVCGGYDRGECLRAVESYCPETNTWTQGANMREARGRVQIAVIDGTVFAVGGSNGTTELDTVECLPKGTQKWSKCCSLPLARSNAGVCAMNGMVYCIGGWNGQSGIKQCDVYDPSENRWSSISPLTTGRTQAGVAAYRGKVWAVGGSDAWNCLATVEVYQPEANVWQLGPNLLTARRGCGLAELNGKLYALGGTDGNHTLNSTEVFDEETKTWTIGPTLTSPRANVSAVVVGGRLYAVGGFSGKTFLNTIEYLDPETNEWTTFVPQQDIDLANIEQSLKEVVENGFKSVSPVPPASVEEKSLQNGENGLNGHNGNGMGSMDHSEEDEDEEIDVDDLNDRRSSVKMINGNGDVCYSPKTRNGKLDEDAIDHPQVAADSDADADEMGMLKTTIVNGSS